MTEAVFEREILEAVFVRFGTSKSSIAKDLWLKLKRSVHAGINFNLAVITFFIIVCIFL